MASVRICEKCLPILVGVWQLRHVRARLELDRDIVLVRPRYCHCDNLVPIWLFQECGCMLGPERGMLRGSVDVMLHALKAEISEQGVIWAAVVLSGGKILPDGLIQHLTKSV